MKMRIMALETTFTVPGWLSGERLRDACVEELKIRLEDAPFELHFSQRGDVEVDHDSDKFAIVGS